MEPRIQYAKTKDGVSIAFWTMGDGEPPLIMSPPLGWGHISLELRVPELARWYKHLASRRMLIRYDTRNEGLSDRNIERLSEHEIASDVEAVIERLGYPQVDLLGFYGLGPVMLRVAAEHPREVRRLVVCSPYVIGERVYASARGLAVRGLIENDWELFTKTFAHERLGWSTEQAGEWAGFIQSAVGQRDAALTLAAHAKIDWSPWLAKIRAPTLVLRDQFNVAASEGRWADISDVRLVDLQDRRPVYISEAGHAAIDEFLSEDDESDARADLPSGMAVILFTDIADSTALTTKLGDVAYREKERELDASLRSAITDVGGTPVEGKVLGDGVMAVFGSASRAIGCAIRCRSIGEDAGLHLHLGIHAGDVVREGNNVHGGAVQLAARVASASAPGEILVSDTVKGLARTSAGVSFEDRGEHELKGIAATQRLYAVRWRE
ncbi:MAG: adenylate/guanylate cyclase domain-containing protein [Chloroflexi bacterium]|nr:adenylate/guanylate cyclase domain-containing protein [Chloroflexota bacterium]